MRQAKILLDDFRKKKLPAVEKFAALELNARPKVADAQRAVAREYGFDNWTDLKKHVETIGNVVVEARQAFRKDDADAFRDLLDRNPAFKAMINQPICGFNSPLVNGVRSEKMLDVLLEAGADINARSDWAPGSFGLLDSAPPHVARYAIERGAVLTPHAAARLGMLDELKKLIGADPQLVH